VRQLLRAFTGSRLNLLLMCAPVSWALWLVAPDSPWLFVIAALSIVPVAGLIGHATDDLAAQTGPTLGGFLNASFGNAAELIIAFTALRENHPELVKASITGSIIGNLLLVFGLSMFVGGLGRPTQRFNRTAAGNVTVMLFLAVVALVMPAVFDLAVFGSLAAHPPVIDRLSFWTSIVLIGAYIGHLIYAFTAQRDLLRAVEEPHRATLTLTQGLTLLGIATVLTAVQAEILIGSLEPTLARFGMTELLVGVIVIAIVGNAAEHYSAITAARNDQMTLSLEIAVGSSAQIALLVAPVLVLASFVMGRPMSLVFNAFEIVAIGLSVFAVAIAALDGESNWVEGLQLLAVYLVLALAFYFIP
jgi:Ca2+:H+ antiporter